MPLVWLVFPDSEQVEVYEPRRGATVRLLARSSELDGGDVLPGFSYPLRRLWD